MIRRSSPALRVVPSFPEVAPPSIVAQGGAREAEQDMPADLPLGELYVRFAPYVAAIASRILGRASEVEDVVQDVFASAVVGLRRRDALFSVRSWLATVTVRSAMKQLRRRALWSYFDLAEPAQYGELVDPGADPEERQLVIEVYRALDGIPARQRVPWILRHVQGESLERTAELCGCSLATTKRRISTAHLAIQARLEGGD